MMWEEKSLGIIREGKPVKRRAEVWENVQFLPWGEKPIDGGAENRTQLGKE